MATSHSDTQKRINNQFPTFSETIKNPEIAYSDHLPVFTKIPLTEDEKTTLNIVSLNILGPSSMSGIHNIGSWEDEEQVKERYGKIAAGLANSVKQQNIECILLQETDERFILPDLKAKLGEAWAVHYTEQGLITCYNTEKLKPMIEGSFEPKHRVLSNTFQHQETGKTIEIHNSWGVFEPFPRAREDQYRLLLSPKEGDNGNVVRVVMGDTNSRIAPLDDIERNIVTGAIPMTFLKEKYNAPEQQIGDYPDGGFYSDLGGNILQMETQVLDFETGEIASSQTDRSELSYVDEFRMVMCLDASYQEKKLIAGSTIFQYEEYLKEQKGDPNIQVSIAANSMNNKAIAIRFSPKSELCKGLEERLKGIPGLQLASIENQVEMRAFPTIFVPVEYIDQITNAIDECLAYDKKPLLDVINAEIGRLNGERGFNLFGC